MAKKKIVKEEINEAVEIKEENTIMEEAVEASEEIEAVDESIDMDPMEEIANDNKMNYVDDLGFSVLETLNAQQIETIADFVNQHQTWTERFYAKAIITLNIATDLTEEEVTSIISGLDIIKKPFVFTVYDNILNWDFVEQAITYYNSVDFKLTNFANMFVALTESADELVKDEAKESVKKVVDIMRQKED